MAGRESAAPVTAAFPGGNGQIVFASNRDDPTDWNVYVMNADGSDQRALTDALFYDAEPTWSPDGARIAFVSNRLGNFRLFVMNADGSEQTALTENGMDVSSPAWSIDGTQIVFDAGPSAQRDLFILDMFTDQITQVTTGAADEFGPAWSPDGRIAFVRDDGAAAGHKNIYTILPNGSNLQPVTTAPGDDIEPAWSPNGTQIAFHSARDNKGSQIYVMNADGSNVRQLTDGWSCCTSPAWSPDGKHIVFRKSFGSQFDIVVMNTDGSDQTVLTADPEWDGGPDWQPLVGGPPTLAVAPQSGVSGTAVTLTGVGFGADNDAATILWDGTPVDELLILGPGSFVWPFTIPADATPGQHTIATCATPTVCAETTFMIIGRQTTTEPAMYYNGDVAVPLAVALEQIGVVAREGVTPAEIEAFTAPYGLHLVNGPEDGGSLSILGRDGALTRDQLVELARAMREDGAALFLEAGLVSTTETSRTDELVIDAPMVINDTFVAKPAPGVSADAFAAYHQTNAVTVLLVDDVIGWLLHVTDAAGVDALDMANRYAESGLVDFALPNFIAPPTLMETQPNDTLFGDQWHHRNTGQHGGTLDADVDTSWAWDITRGSPDVVIAVIDTGFDAEHPDLSPNLWTNFGETAGDGIDNDGNGYVDDVHGWNFSGCIGENTAAGCGRTDLSGYPHGTAVAGVAAAAGNNNRGVSGSCPNCRLMLVAGLQTTDLYGIARAIRYAADEGAAILNNSWGIDAGLPLVAAINHATTTGRSGRGSVVLFAMQNWPTAYCQSWPTNLPNVIAVGGTSNWDRRVNDSAWGNCLDVLASTWRGYGPAHSNGQPYTGTLNITTTDDRGEPGYNRNVTPNRDQPCPRPQLADLDYNNCFSGNSSATPLTAGVVGLLLSANPQLTALQAQQLLQDTADKIEDSAAAYSAVNGYNMAPANALGRGYGRINAYEAVRVVASPGPGGRGNVDVFVRDNRLDWGNAMGHQDGVNSATLLEQTRGFIPFWESPDIKVDSPANGFQPAPTNSAEFEALVHENPVPGQENRVYVRVRNRGHRTAAAVTVKLHYAFAGTALPSLPPDFWPRFPGDSLIPNWPLRPIGVKTLTNLGYSGASVAGTSADAAQIAAFSFTAPPPQTDPTTGAAVTHLCFFVVVDSPQDSVDPRSRLDLVIDRITPNDNNVAHRNVNLTDTTPARQNRAAFYVRNPYPEPIRTFLRLDAAAALAQNWAISLDGLDFDEPLDLAAGEERLVTLNVEAPQPGQEAVIAVQQIGLLPVRVEEEVVLGGVRYHFAPLMPAEYRLFLPGVLVPR